MHSSLLLAYFHFYACLPIKTTACVEKKNDPIFNETSKELGLALNENFANIRQEEQCAEKKIADAANPNAGSAETTFLPLCRGIRTQDGQIIAIDLSQMALSSGSNAKVEVFPSQVTVAKATTDMNNFVTQAGSIRQIGSGLSDFATAAKTFAQDAEDVKKITDLLGAVSGGLSIVSGVMTLAFPPKDVATEVINAMNERFDALSRKLDEITRILLNAIVDLKKTLADVTLDQYMGDLIAIDSAYKELLFARDPKSNSTESEKNYYADKYRSVCNTPFKSPADIIRGLYGYFCGNETTPLEELKVSTYDCNSQNPRPHGFCSIAPRKKLSLLDNYEEWVANDINKLLTLTNWLRPALILAYSHHITCPSTLANSCMDKSVDPVFNHTTTLLGDAIAEVTLNFARLEYCTTSDTWKRLDDDFIKAHVNPDGHSYSAAHIYARQILEALKSDDGFNLFEWSVVVWKPIGERDWLNNELAFDKCPDFRTNTHTVFMAPDHHDSISGRFYKSVKIGDARDTEVCYSFYFMYVRKGATKKSGKEILKEKNFVGSMMSCPNGVDTCNNNNAGENADYRLIQRDNKHDWYEDLLQGYGYVIIRPGFKTQYPYCRPQDLNAVVFQGLQGRDTPLRTTNANLFGFTGCRTDASVLKIEAYLGEWEGHCLNFFQERAGGCSGGINHDCYFLWF